MKDMAFTLRLTLTSVSSAYTSLPISHSLKFTKMILMLRAHWFYWIWTWSYHHSASNSLSHRYFFPQMVPIVRTKFEFPAHYMDGLRPKKPKNNEFVESGLENWALVNQTNTGKDSDDKRMKRKKSLIWAVFIPRREQRARKFPFDSYQSPQP